jgi:LysM repeat protein
MKSIKKVQSKKVQDRQSLRNIIQSLQTMATAKFVSVFQNKSSGQAILKKYHTVTSDNGHS